MGIVYTLSGPVDALELGAVLPHEHFPLHYNAWEREEFEPGSKWIVRQWFGPVLDELLEAPFRTMVEVSPIGHGRDIAFRRELLGGRPIHVVPCTGFYLDSNQPEWAKEKSAEELAEFMIKELDEGIDGSDVRAGIIKLAPNPASGQSRKVCRAAAMASLRTGACVTTHSCSANRSHFDYLTSLGVPPERIYIGHADFVSFEENRHVCREGGHVLFTVWDIDYMIPNREMYKRFAELVQAGYVRQVLMSVDFAILVHEPARPQFLSWTLYGIEGRTHSYLHRVVIPRLMSEYGLDRKAVEIITVETPREMLDFRR